MKRVITLLIGVALFMALVPAVLAGGWAVVVLDDVGGEIRAGEPWTVGFTVLQHGKTPIHNLDGDNWPVEPLIVIENMATGERQEITARPTKVTGHFAAELTFPEEGTWAWTIYPHPLAGETGFEPLTVLPAEIAAPAFLSLPDGFGLPALFRLGALLLATAAVGLVVLQLRARNRPAQVE